ncbi:hypothetical protein K0M31_016630 [Melipona bicolor]|uniref:Uncharacterized protein n=1 Tax=Melipona bicolor TaxID=60889 RepID=A0AA40KEI3_9HYME|nr:hypothetical protein K0M31_016630 [Melipona bicolor]
MELTQHVETLKEINIRFLLFSLQFSVKTWHEELDNSLQNSAHVTRSWKARKRLAESVDRWVRELDERVRGPAAGNNSFRCGAAARELRKGVTRVKSSSLVGHANARRLITAGAAAATSSQRLAGYATTTTAHTDRTCEPPR